MSDDREFLRATTDWLEAGSDRTPPKVVDGVLLAIRTTRQDRVLRSPWRPIDMNALAKALVAATAVAAIALAWINFAPSGNNFGAPIPTTSPSPTPTPAAIPSGEPVALVPGRYVFASLHNGVPAQLGSTYPKLSFTVPSGWSGGGSLASKDYGSSGTSEPILFVWHFDHGFKDPCTDHTAVLPAAGSGAAGLLGVIAAQPGIDAGAITDVTVGGHRGKYVDYTVTADPASCGNGQDGFWIWASCPAPVTPGCEDVSGDTRWGASKDARERAYAIDVDGTIYTFITSQPVDLLAADRIELQQVLDSIEFEPPG